MNRIDRLNAIRILLESRRLITAKEIANHFELSLRTVYRDIKALQEAGIEIEGEAGMGYSLAKNANLAPVSFRPTEALSMLMAAKVIGGHLDSYHSKEFDKALTKIRAALPDREKDTLERLEQKIAVPNFGYQQAGMLDPQALHPIQEALVQGAELEIDYFSNYRQAGSVRQVVPIGILFYSGFWHMIAWCQMRKDYRDFRVDRIRTVKNLGYFSGKEELLSLDDYLSGVQAQIQSYRNKTGAKGTGQLEECRIYFHNDFYWLYEKTRYRFGFVRQRLITKGTYEGWTEATFYFDNLAEMARWLLSFTHKAIPHHPESLCQEFQKNISLLTQSHEK